MLVDEGISFLGDRFVSMSRSADVDLGDGKPVTVTRVECCFKSRVDGYNWIVPGTDDNRIIVLKNESKAYNYYIISTDENVTYSDIFDHCKFIVDVNMETELKSVLLQEKISQLGKLFAELPYSTLKKIKFTYGKTDAKCKKPTEVNPPTEKETVKRNINRNDTQQPRKEKRGVKENDRQKTIIVDGEEIGEEIPLDIDESENFPKQVIYVGMQENGVDLPPPQLQQLPEIPQKKPVKKNKIFVDNSPQDLFA